MRYLSFIVLCFCFIPTGALAGGSQKYCGKDAQACVKYGANVFQVRCALCHGTDGHGEGILSMQIKDYPNTNLLDSKHGKDLVSLRKAINFGGSIPEISDDMPPWGDELTATQLESVVMFVHLLHTKREKALTLLRNEAENIKPSMRLGRGIYQGRCTLCHGKQGEGDGKMARIIKDPPPFNLTLSRVPDNYLRKIINKGGQAVGRSPRMPPWGTDLSENEIESIIIYLKSLRQ